MTTVNLQNALDFCITSGATVEESAKKFGVDKNELSRILSEMMNPNGGGEVGDKADFSQTYGNAKVANARLMVKGQEFNIVVVGIDGEKGASYRAYDENGMEVSGDDLKKAFKIDSFKINEDGEINVVVYPDAPKMTIAQRTDGEFGLIDSFKNFWKNSSNKTNEGVVVVASKQPAINKAVAQMAEDYGVDKEAFAAIADAVTKAEANISAEAKENVKQLTAKVENAKTDEEKQAAVSEFVKFVGALIPDLPEELGFNVDLPPAVMNACAAVVLAALVVGAAAGGVAALSTRAGQIAATVFVGVGMTSCSPEEDIDINKEYNVGITLNDGLEEAINKLIAGQETSNYILQQILEREIQNGMTAEEILALVGGHTDILNQILASMTENNNLLTEIKNSIGDNSAVLEALVGIQNSLDVLTSLVAEAPDYSDQLQDIIDQINDGNTKIETIQYLIEQLLKEVAANGDTQVDILAMLQEIQNSNISEGEKLVQMLELLKNIDTNIENIYNVINEIKDSFGDDQGIKDALDALIKLVQEGNAKQDVTNKMLSKLLEMMQNGVSKDDIKAIIEAISQNGDKIDAVNQFLNKIQNQDLEFQEKILAVLADLGTSSVDVMNQILTAIGGNGEKLDAIAQLLAKIDNNVEKYGEEGKELGNKILEAINKLGVDISGQLTQILDVINSDADTGKNIESLLQKVLEKMDSNTKDIIDAIANIKVGDGGNVDLSSLEKMLSELLQLTSKNNSLLESIDGKMDVINLTIERAKEEILAKMDQNDANTTAILKALNEFKNISDANSKKILAKMDTIINVLNNIKDSTYDDTALMAKLDEILAAIKDHNITVDITGKVTCDCNCGGNHEGIIGDLEDILG